MRRMAVVNGPRHNIVLGVHIAMGLDDEDLDEEGTDE
jgi:hypothetical protein